MFFRTARGTAITPDGQYLLPVAEQMLAATRQCQSHFGGAGQQVHPLRVPCAFGVYALLVDGLVNTYKQGMPQTRFEMTEYPDKRCMETRQKGQTDI